MGELVGLAGDVLLDQVVFPLAGQNGVDLLRGVTADIGPKHDAALRGGKKQVR